MFRFFTLLVILLLTSCKYLPNFTEDNQPKLDTIIDFTRVDVSPSFKTCGNLLEQEKTRCFRETMQNKVGEMLQSFSDTIAISVDQTIMLELLIDKEGNTTIELLEIPEIIEKEIPNLKVHIETSINDFPKLSPALKRGIPVATQYKLPIHIKTE